MNIQTQSKKFMSHGNKENNGDFDIQSKIDESCFLNRNIYLWGEINEDSSYSVINLLKLYFSTSSDPVTIFINSDGGSVADAMAIIDEMNRYKKLGNIVITVAVGNAFSAAGCILAAGSKGHRFSYSSASIMLHTVAYGTATDYAVNNEAFVAFVKKTNEKLYKQIAEYMEITENKDYKKFYKNISDGLWMTPQEAMEKKVVDQILE